MADGNRQASVLLHPSGPLDADSCNDLRLQLAAAFAAGVTSIVVDLRAVPAVDLTGLGVLLGAAKHLAQTGGTLVLAHPREAVRSMLAVNDALALLEPEAPPAEAPAPRRRPAPRTLSVVRDDDVALPG